MPVQPPRIKLLAIRWGTWAGVPLLYVLLAAWAIWPAPRHAYRTLPTASTPSATVPMLNAWTIWWNVDRLSHLGRGYWNAPIFHPERGTFAFSDPQPATCAVAPVLWLTGSPIAAYQVYLLLSLVLNGVFTVRVLRTLRADRWIALAGGVGVLLLPVAHQRIEVLQLVPIWGVLWSIDVLIRLHRRPRGLLGLELAAALLAVFSTSVHHGLFWGLLLLSTAWITIRPRRWKRWCVGMAVAGGTTLMLLLPLLLPMQRIHSAHEFQRQDAMVRALSASPGQWCELPPGALWPTRQDAARSLSLSPGWGRLVIAVAGFLLLFRRRRKRPIACFLAAILALALLLSLGLNLSLGAWEPWTMLRRTVPGFSQVRSPFRFAYFAQLAVILLAAWGLQQGVVHVRRTARPWPRYLGTGALVLAGLLIALEVLPPRVYAVSVPDVTRPVDWRQYLRHHVREGQGVVCLPLARGETVEAHRQTTWWMLHATQHQAALVNGYSGFFPDSWYRMSRALTRDPLSRETLAMLVEANVAYLVVDRRQVRLIPTPAPQADGRQLVRVFRSSEGIDIWQLPTARRQ